MTGEPNWQAFQDDLMAASLAGELKSVDARTALSPADLLVTLSQFRQQNEQQWPAQYRAARTVYASTDNMPLVLNGLTTVSRSQQQLAKLAWKPWRYLVFLAFVACLGLMIYWAFVLPSLKRLRTDLELVPLPITSGQSAVFFPAANFRSLDAIPWVVLGLLAAVVIGTGVLWATGGLTKLFRGRGRHGVVQNSALATAGRVTADLLQRGVELEAAMATSSDLVVGTAALVQPIRDLALVPARDSGVLPAHTQTVAALLRSAQHFDSAARARLLLLQNVLPLVLVMLIGGVGTLIYSVTLFRPLVQLIDDSSLPVQLTPPAVSTESHPPSDTSFIPGRSVRSGDLQVVFLLPSRLCGRVGACSGEGLVAPRQATQDCAVALSSPGARLSQGESNSPIAELTS